MSREHPIRIVMISAEVESLARTGGLGDVVLALSFALAALGAEVLVVTPFYGVTTLPSASAAWDEEINVQLGESRHSMRVLEPPRVLYPEGGSVRFCLLDAPALYARQGIYGDASGTFGDNDLRFAALSMGALEVAARVFGEPAEGQGPDVVHGHDWHAALSAVYGKHALGGAWSRVPQVFTLHNIAYQGLLGHDAIQRLGVPPGLFHPEVLEQLGAVNLVKGATALADRITTVSPTHAREILTREGGFGLDGHLRAHAWKLRGIVNGIDMARFDPSADMELARRYDDASSFPGRAACKAALSQELGLAPARPLFGMVSRLTWQKGVDLFLGVLEDLIARGAGAVILGAGERELEDAVRAAASRHPGNVASRVTFEPGLARRIFSAADFIVVPSRFEPCGLTQMYAMRYGALPIVTRVGGLADTVLPMEQVHDRGTGFVAPRATARDLIVACDDALVLHQDARSMRSAVLRAMRRDSSWTPSAREYLALYRELAPRR